MNGESTNNPDYPDAYGRMERNAFGFDVWELDAIPPVTSEGETHDYMSYDKNNQSWVSIYRQAARATWGSPGGEPPGESTKDAEAPWDELLAAEGGTYKRMGVCESRFSIWLEKVWATVQQVQ